MKNKKKILFVTNKAPHYRIPLFKMLSKEADVTFCFTNEEEKKDLKANQIILSGVGIGKFSVHFSLVKEINSKKYDLVFMLPPDPSHLIDNYLIYLACKKNKVPFIFWTERWEYFQMPFRDKVSNFFHKRLLRMAKKVLVSGKKSYSWVRSLKINDKNIVLAPNASKIIYNKKNIDKIKASIIKKYKLKNKKVVLYLGRLIDRKGLDYLIEAFSKIKDSESKLIFVGGGDFYKLGEKSIESKLKKQVKNLGIEDNVVFTGEVDHSETAAYYSVADVFTYPSITKRISEPWGLTLNEAMQFSLPIISTNAVGSAYDLILNGKNGFMVKEKKVDELKEALSKVLKDKSLRKRMGIISKNIINKKNNYSNMLGGFLKVLK